MSTATQLQTYRKPLIGLAVAVAIYALLGFFLAPWLVEKNATEAVQENLGTELTFEEVAVNPFVLSLELRGLELDEPAGERFLSVERIFVNFQLSSLFRWAWTFRELYIESPEVRLSRDGNGEFNFAFLTQQPSEPAEPEPADGPVRLLIQDFAITDSVIDWHDEVPPEPVDTEFGPVNIAISELNTLPDRAGLQDVVITTESQGTLSWNGDLQLNPLRTEGHASLQGGHFPLTSAYLKYEAGFDVFDGEVDVEFDYRIDTRADGVIEAEVREFDLTFSDVEVRTFNAALGRPGDDRDVLTLPSMSLSGGELHWPERRASAESFSLDDAVVTLFRDENGALNVLPPDESTESEADDAGAAEESAASSDPWQLSLSRFNISQLALALEDRSVEPAAEIGWQSLDVDVRNISNEPSASFPTTLELVAREGGTVSVDGQLTVLPEPAFEFDLLIEALALAGAHPYMKALADVNFDSGALNVDMQVVSDPDDSLRAAGDVEIVDFLITETDEGSRLGSWVNLRAENLVYSAAGNTLDISEVHFTEPYGDILIAEDGSINLGRVQKGESTEAGEAAADEDADAPVESTEEAAASEDDEAPDSENDVAVTIGRVVIDNASADFADLSLPLPFSAQIAELNGEMSTIATTSEEPSTVEMEGKVDEFGQVQIGGTITPLDPPANTDIKVAFQNVDMPKFSAYSIPFAGREIASGRLDLDLGYKITENRLEGENSILLRDFELGDKVDHPDAMSLPLGLAVALLKDPDGRISLDVPVRGEVDDPEFKIGGVVVKALVNVLTRIVTSPFALLANLVGADAGELEHLVFEPGRADLSPPELEKAAKIAEALGMRPQLVLQLRGVYEPDADGAVIRAEKVDARIEERIAATDGDDEGMYADQRSEAIVQLFTEAQTGADPAVVMAELRTEHTTTAEDGSEQFDQLAYTEALRSRLVELQPLTEPDLLTLANGRAQSIREAMLAANAELATRIAVEDAAVVEADDDGNIRVQVRLSASEDLPPQAPTTATTAAATATASATASFQCADGPMVTTRVFDADRLELDDGQTIRTLTRTRSASGARYGDADVEFWEKGDEAMLTIGESRYDCLKTVAN